MPPAPLTSFKKTFERTHSILISRDDIENITLKKANQIKTQFRLFRDSDLDDFFDLLRIKRSKSKVQFKPEYTFEHFDSENNSLGSIFYSKKGKLKFKNESNNFLVIESQLFNDWLYEITSQFYGLKNGKIVGCKILDLEHHNSYFNKESPSFSEEEWYDIKKMGRFIEEYYQEKEFGKMKCLEDDTPNCCIRAIIWPPIKTQNSSWSDSEDKKIKFITDTRVPLKGNEIYVNSHTEERICSKTGDWCDKVVFTGKKRHKVDLAAAKRDFLREEIRIDYDKTKFPLVSFFCTDFDFFNYFVCYDYEIAFTQKKEFGLFLMFKLRNTSSTEINYWLDYFHERKGDVFVRFLKKVVKQFDYLIKEEAIKSEINNWILGEKFQLTHTPEGNKKIELKINKKQIEKFFSFLYLETNGSESSFLTKSEVTFLLKDGLSLPSKAPVDTFNLGLKKYTVKSPGVIGYCFYLLSQEGEFSVKEELALFMHYHFKYFRNLTTPEIKEMMRNQKPAKMKFEIKGKYLS